MEVIDGDRLMLLRLSWSCMLCSMFEYVIDMEVGW